MEQLNIVGKRSGKGFVTHLAMLVSALSRALSERVTVIGITVGRKGLLGYLKALGGSNIIKVIPSNGSDSDKHTTVKGLKVICGQNTSIIGDSHWIGENTPPSACDVRVSPLYSVKPNVGVRELADAIARVLPFTAKDDARPTLQCVNFVAKDGKLTLVSADGFRLATLSLDLDDTEGNSLISSDDLKGVATALRKAQRVRVGFASNGSLDGHSLVIETELVRYTFVGVDGEFPDWQKLIPTEFNVFASIDTVEAIRAVNSLKAFADNKECPLDLTIKDGLVVMANPDVTGQAELPADILGEGTIRIDGGYLRDALKACGGMVDLSITNRYSPMLFSQNGYRLVVMPMLTAEATEQQKADSKAKGADSEPETEPVAEPVAESEVEKPKARRSRKTEPAAVK